MIYRIFHFIRHFPVYMKYYYTNYRCEKYNYRRFRYTLFIEQKDDNGNTIGMQRQPAKVTVMADYSNRKKLESIPIPDYLKQTNITPEEYRKEQLPFIMMRDEHHSIFEICDHLTVKEII